MRKEIICLIAGIGLVYTQASNAGAGEMRPTAKSTAANTTMHYKNTTTVEHRQPATTNAHKINNKHHAKAQHYKHHRKQVAAQSKTASLHQKQFSKTHNAQTPVSYESYYGPKGARSSHETMNQSSLDQYEHAISDNGIERDHR